MNRACSPGWLRLLAPAALLALSVSSPAQAQAQSPRQAQGWAIVAGIDEYQDSNIPRCPSARADALEIARWFRETAGWGGSHLIELQRFGQTDPPRALQGNISLTPTRSNLDWAVDQVVSGVQPGDFVLIYFAGQAGALPANEKQPANSPETPLLYAIDARPNDPEGQVWKLDLAVERLAIKGSVSVLCWLDTSLSGRGSTVTNVLAPAHFVPSGRRYLDRLTRFPGVSAWMAADGQPAASPSPFRKLVLEALGSADKPANLSATLASLRSKEALTRQGFLVEGGLPERFSLWKSQQKPLGPPKLEIILQRGHSGGVGPVLFTADDQGILSSGVDSSIRLWRRSDGRLVRVVGDLANGVSALALSPDGQTLASGDTTGRVVFWNMGKQAPIPVQPPASVHNLARIQQIAALPDALHFASVDKRGKAASWDASGPRVLQKPLVPDQIVMHVDTPVRPGPVSLAALDTTGKIHLFDQDVQPLAVLKPENGDPASRPVSIRVNASGDRLAVGTRGGRVLVRALPEGNVIRAVSVDEQPVFKLGFSNSGDLVAATGQHVFCLKEGQEKPLLIASIDSKPTALEVSNDGRWAAFLASGGLQLFQAGETGEWQAVDGLKALEEITSLAFSGDSRELVTGSVDGSLRIIALPGGGSRVLAPSFRGRIASLSVSDDARYLLELTSADRDAGVAMVWDLEDSKDVRVIPGQWASGSMMPDGSSSAMLRDSADTSVPGLAGRVQLVDHHADPPRILPTRFEIPDQFKTLRFDLLSVSPDGRLIAAATRLQAPRALVWSADKGKLLASIVEQEPGSFTVLTFAPDGKTLLTGTGTGILKLWALPDDDAPAAQSLKAPRSVFRFQGRPGQDTGLTACAFDPANPKRIALATLGGRISIWTEGEPIDQELIDMFSRAHSVAFSRDGAYLTAGSDRRDVQFWKFNNGRPERITTAPPDWHHERVTTLLPWPQIKPLPDDVPVPQNVAPVPLDGVQAPPAHRMIVSGSWDTSIRFWDPDASPDRAGLVGTLSAILVGAPAPGEKPNPANPLRPEWIAYAPDGRFDGTYRGQEEIQVRLDDTLVDPEQLFRILFSFRLGNQFRFGLQPNPHGPRELLTPPPAIAIDSPSVADGQAEITLTLGHADPNSVRLYHNGIPVRGGIGDFQIVSRNPTRVQTRVQLLSGMNHFYAMAGSPDQTASIDGRSRVVSQPYTEVRPSRLHVVAMGVGQYNRQKLQFAVADAASLADYLRHNGLAGAAARVSNSVLNRESFVRVLSDDDVTVQNLDKTFEELKQATAGHPEDTVVVFLAGHTDVYKGRFCLLRSTFPFDEAAPVRVAQRGAPIWPVNPKKAAEVQKHLMPYSSIAGRLARIDPLQRLVIVDACQAEAIFDDFSVRSIEEHFTRDSHEAKTSYILASRAGEPAGESSVLKHGLLTYTLLRGMQDPDVLNPPVISSIYQDHPSADEDRDHLITAAELRQYARETLPPLAVLLGDAGAVRGRRGGPGARLKSDTMSARPSNASFPIIQVTPRNP